MSGKTHAAVKELIEQSMQSQTLLNKSFEAMGIDPKVARTVAPLDDSVEPETPKNVRATSFIKAVQVSWDAPPDTDAVARYEVEVAPSGTTSYIANGTGFGLSQMFNDLAYVSHTFRVRFVDKFNRASAWSTAVTATPAESAQYKIDMTKANILGNLQGLLPNANLATIQDATKLGSGVVLAESMAVQNAAAMNLWVGTGAIQRAFLANAIIDNTKIANAAIKTAHIGDAEITSAKISSLVVDKLTGGDIEGKTFTLVGTGKFDVVRGSSRVVYTRLSTDGLQLRDEGNFFEPPDVNVGAKITPIRGVVHSAIGFGFASNRKGIYMPAVGDGTRNGTIALEAFQSAGAVGTTNSARLFLDSRSGEPNLAQLRATDIVLDGALRTSGTSLFQSEVTISSTLRLSDAGRWVPQRSGDFTIAAGGMLNYFHRLDGIPYRVEIWTHFGNGFWSPVQNGVYSWRTFISATELEIYNDSTTSKRVRFYIDRV